MSPHSDSRFTSQLIIFFAGVYDCNFAKHLQSAQSFGLTIGPGLVALSHWLHILGLDGTSLALALPATSLVGWVAQW